MPEAYGFTAHGGPDAVLDAVGEQVAAGMLRPLATCTYPLHRAPEALRLVAQGRARGKTAIEAAPW